MSLESDATVEPRSQGPGIHPPLSLCLWLRGVDSGRVLVNSLVVDHERLLLTVMIRPRVHMVVNR